MMKRVLIAFISFIIISNTVFAENTDTISVECSPNGITSGESVTCNLYVTPISPISNMSIQYIKSAKTTITSFTANNTKLMVLSDPVTSNYIDFITATDLLPSDGKTLIGTFIIKLDDDYYNDTAFIEFNNAVAGGTDGDDKDQIIPSTRATIDVNPTGILKGDLNNNKIIDLQDVIILLKIYLGAQEADEYSMSIGDMNDNNSININDIIILLRLYLNS